MFGRKKRKLEKMKELQEKIKDKETNIPIPTQIVTTPAEIPIPQQPAISVAPQKTIQQSKMTICYIIGKKTSYPEQSIEKVDPIYTLSIDDIIDIIAKCEGTNIGTYFRKLLKEILG